MNRFIKAALISIAIGWLVRRRLSVRSQGPVAQNLTVPKVTACGDAGQRRPFLDRPIASLLTFIAAVALLPLGFYLGRQAPTTGSYGCLLLSMALSAFMLRGPSRHHGVPATLIMVMLFTFDSLIALVATINGFDSSADAVFLLKVTIFATLALAVAVCLAATWLRGWPFIEAAAIGLIAISLGSLCFPGLSFLTEDISVPLVPGAGVLFASGAAGQSLSFYATADSSEQAPYSESLQVNDVSAEPVRWVLLLTRGARVVTRGAPDYPYSVEPSKGVRLTYLTASGVGVASITGSATAELFSGTLNGGSSIIINGAATGAFADYTSDRSAVTLPDYGQGLLSEFGSNTQAAIIRALGSRPIYRTAQDFTTSILTGPMSPLDSVTADTSSPASNSFIPDHLEWITHSSETISYASINQAASDTATNLLFVFAIMFGLSGAGIIAALQSMIHQLVIPSRRAKGYEVTER